jgi:hypothetical protein
MGLLFKFLALCCCSALQEPHTAVSLATMADACGAKLLCEVSCVTADCLHVRYACCRYEPSRRATARELQQHAYFADVRGMVAPVA